MHAQRIRFFTAVLSMLMLAPTRVQINTATVSPLFDLSSPDRSPFPSDRFTVADADQNTGRRVNLPIPDDCIANASECEDRAVLNQLDGFNMQTRIPVPFDGEIDPASVTGSTVFLLNLGDALARPEDRNSRDREDERWNPRAARLPPNAIVGINQIVLDPETRELSFRPDDSLEQYTRYALVVTTGVRDSSGNSIGVAEGFRRYLHDLAHDVDRYYLGALLTAEWAVRRAFDHRIEVAAVSVFTTQSFSHIIERMRDAILVVGVVTGAIFGYYFRELRLDEREPKE